MVQTTRSAGTCTARYLYGIGAGGRKDRDQKGTEQELRRNRTVREGSRMIYRRRRKESKKNNYIFTAKKHPEKGIMSFILGAISAGSVAAAVYGSYRSAGVSVSRYGTAVFLALLFTIAGMWLGWSSRLEKDNYYLFPNLGIVCNLAVMILISAILYSGI